jgi:type I restriction enzyme S subunit
LAVRGKLVEQDPKDEPASELLKRIQAEGARLAKEGGIRKQEVPLPVMADDEPYHIPAIWSWTRLGQIGNWSSGSTPPRGNPEYYGGGITWLKSGELNDNQRLAGSEETVTKLAVSKCSFRENRPGDVLIAMYGATIGKLAILAEPAVTNQAVCGCTPLTGISNRYLFDFLLSQRAQFHSASEGGAQPNISKAKIVGFAFPLPPFAEQHRIVAKVDELMSLCDRLEATQGERESRRDRLAAASLHRLNQPADTDGPEVFRDHARVYLNHLPRLTTRPEQVKQLRQTILNLAVRGRLVRQDPSDEPASELLKRVQTGNIGSDSPLPAIVDDEAPFRLPSGWQWVRFGELITAADAGWSPKSEGFPRSGDGWGVLKVSAVSWDRFLPEENKQLLPGVTPPKRAQVHAGDFLISRANTSELVAKCVVVDAEPRNLILSDKIVRLQIDRSCSSRFLCLVNNHAAHARSYYAEEASGTSLSMKNVSRAVIYALAIPLPPLAEQHRIVAKVDELMSLCDQLEAQLISAQTERRRLLEAVLHEALPTG